MKHLTRDEHLFGPGPKRVLSLDGGGVRGVLALEYLKRIEDLLLDRHGRDASFRLCDYFDLIAGTSTGAVIAAALALGFSVEQIQTLYCELAEDVFQASPLRIGIFAPKFSRSRVMAAMAAQCGDTRLGDDSLRTGLMLALKRVDTNSPWLVHNNPRGKFYAGGDAPNRDLLLRQVVYASAAAPHYFEPESFEVAPGVEGSFVDGAIAGANNPALHALMVASLKGYGLCWPLGQERLLLVSVGTGMTIADPAASKWPRPALVSAVSALTSMIGDVSWLVQTLLQWMSDSPARWQIDSELGDLAEDRLGDRALLTYVRYNALLQAEWLRDELGMQISETEVAGLGSVDQPDHIGQLANIGRQAAAKQVRDQDFPACFDLLADEEVRS